MRATVTDLVFASIVNATYTRKRLNYVLIFFLSFFARNIIDTGLYLVIRTGGPLIDFSIAVSITLGLLWLSPWIEDFILRYEVEVRVWTNSLIDNYTYERYKLWRKRIVFTGCLGLLVFLNFYEVTSSLLMLSVTHFMVTSYIVDKAEDYRLDKGWIGQVKQYVTSRWSRLTNWIRLKLNQPSVIMHSSPEFVSSYYPQPQNDLYTSRIDLNSSGNGSTAEMKIGSRIIVIERNYKGL